MDEGSAATLRPLVRADVDAIAAIHAAACAVAYRFMNWNYPLSAVRDWYANEKFAQWDFGLVAERGGAPAGFLAMTGAHIDQLFVHPDHQGRGVGTMLFETALGRGLRPVTLNVFEQNAPARRFYERYGFVERDRWFNDHDRAMELRYVLD